MCKECKALGVGGGAICEHNRQRCACKECGGSTICKHSRPRSICKECKALGTGGSLVCEHGKQRCRCRDCGGASICEHGKQRHVCRDCKVLGIGGSQVCEHGKTRCVCKDCGGGSVCEHGNARGHCRECSPKYFYKKYQHGARIRNITFSLTFDEYFYLSKQPCFYCGSDSKTNGVDRWDNDLGYEFENSRPCCKHCNLAKLNRDGSEFVEWLRRAADHTRSVENADSYAAFEAAQN